MRKKITIVECNVTAIGLITGEEILVLNDRRLTRGANSADKHSTALAVIGGDLWTGYVLDCKAILRTKEPIELIRPSGDSIYFNPAVIVKVTDKAYCIDFDESDLK